VWRLLSQRVADSLRERFSVKPGDFVVVLIGKDGGEKLPTEPNVNLGNTFGLIDSMPMGQQEMRGKRGGTSD